MNLRSSTHWLAVIALACATVANAAPKKILIDADPGIDDSMAILFALRSPALEVVGITTVFGNTTVELGTRNALALVELAGADVPVVRGAGRALVQPPHEPPTFVHGENGIGDVDVAPPKASPAEGSAAQFIVEMARAHPGEITLVPVGPLTNVALALAIEPELPKLIREVVLMGGAAHVPGNVSAVAEANIWNDAHAADDVLSAPWSVTMVGLDVTTKVRMKDDRLRRMADADPTMGGFVWKISRYYKRFYESIGVTGGFYVHDPSALAYVVDPTLFTTRAARVRVATEGIASGQTIPAYGTPPDFWTPWSSVAHANTSVCVDVDAERLLDLYEATLVK